MKGRIVVLATLYHVEGTRKINEKYISRTRRPPLLIAVWLDVSQLWWGDTCEYWGSTIPPTTLAVERRPISGPRRASEPIRDPP